MQFDQLIQNSGCGYKAPPSDPSNLKQVIQDVLEAEACAIGTYSKLSEKYRMTDIVTHEIFETLLEDEVSDEEQWENSGQICKLHTLFCLLYFEYLPNFKYLLSFLIYSFNSPIKCIFVC